MEGTQRQDILLSVVGIPCARIAKSFFKLIAVKIRYGKDAIPARYELIRILYAGSLSLHSAFDASSVDAQNGGRIDQYMCGINGITRRDRELVRRMNKVTAHRGPDGVGIYENDSITFGHNRLAIIDLSEKVCAADEERGRLVSHNL